MHSPNRIDIGRMPVESLFRRYPTPIFLPPVYQEISLSSGPFHQRDKALRTGGPPGLRIATDLFAYRLGNEREAQAHYRRGIEQFEACDSLSQPYVMDYVFAPALSHQKEKARRVIDCLACDTLFRRQLLSLAENPQDAIDESIP